MKTVGFLGTLFFCLWGASTALAYPDFIGYGYRSCLTCHFNGNGNGPLNDYGRALFATEITSRAVFPKKTTDDEIGDKSGFLGSTELPWWIRPGAKYRGIYVQRNPGGSSDKAVSKYITMQADLNMALLFDRAQKFIFVGSIGYVPVPQTMKNAPPSEMPSEWISREHYFRWQQSKNMFWYLGLTDRVFGIRHPNHTSFSRSRTEMSMNDQSHGLIGQYVQPKFEISVNAFAGNQSQDADLRQQGGSMMTEYEFFERKAFGISLLGSKNKYTRKTMGALHARIGLPDSKGDSLMFEIGQVQNRAVEEALSHRNSTGTYTFTQGLFNVARGYNWAMNFETYKSTPNDITTRWGGGLLAFPLPRTEFRLDVVNTRVLSTNAVKSDTWEVQTQLHLSL
ncbi:MAG: hypothetical protein KF802_08865 [Bdellovibrionaceae bacterium]|nr:hypothetical protein [Pseudobdellovibrionaceae bacterium]MBX3034160.1 hypothetical protein [Pseudobdellovibrionaceae bacterium]